MAARPWITPEDVRRYSDDDSVAARSDEKLAIDISRAESYILAYTHNKSLLDDEKYPEVPENIKTAAILIAEHYATASATSKGFTSESFDDYSYSKDSSYSFFDDLGLGMLLNEFMESGSVKLNVTVV